MPHGRPQLSPLPIAGRGRGEGAEVAASEEVPPITNVAALIPALLPRPGEGGDSLDRSGRIRPISSPGGSKGHSA